MSETEFRFLSEEDAPVAETGVELLPEDIPTTEGVPAPEDIPATETDLSLGSDESPVVQAAPSAVLGPEKRTCPSCNQENEIVREFCWACYGKLGDSKAGNGAGSQPEHGTPPVQGMPVAPGIAPSESGLPATVRPGESRRGEDVLVDYGPSVKLAYNPSGQMGKTLTLLFHGATGVLVGLFKAALVLAAAVVVNIVHNLLPVFIFVLPLVIVGLMLIAPNFDWKTRIGSFMLDGCGSPITPVTDIAITGVSAPGPVVQGTIVEVSVTVANVGNQDVTGDIEVTLTVVPNEGTIDSPQTISGGLLAGAFTDQTFLWDTTEASTVEHTLRASHDVANDNDTSNDSGITVVEVTDSTPPAGVTVTSIDPDTMLTDIMIDVNVTVMGSGFVTGAQVTFENGSGPAPTASNVVVESSMAITAKVTAKSSGPRGDRVWDVRVTNTDGSFDVLPGGFTVTR